MDLTPKQEAFAQLYVETGNAAASYRQAYDKDENARDEWIYVEASQLLDHPKVSLRIEQLQEEARQRSRVTIHQASTELESARDLAMKMGNPNAAVAAISAKMKLFGLESPKRSKMEVDATVHNVISADPITEEEWAAQHTDVAD